MKQQSMDKIARYDVNYSGDPKFLTLAVGDGEIQHLAVLCDEIPYTELFVPTGNLVHTVALPLPLCKEVALKGAFTDSFYSKVSIAESPKERPVRTMIHYAPEFGWCNDPNGLIYTNGQYQMCYQYNPCGTDWNNMSWAGTSTQDFIHWEPSHVLMLPDKNGTVFSGCAIPNDHALLDLPKEATIYFYTAAGASYKNPQKEPLFCDDVPFTQRYAYSLDGGRSIVRPEKNEIIGSLGYSARDPKVFWYEPRQCYCMILYHEENRFAILHSSDLLHWEETQRFSLPGSWECPDLFCLKSPQGEEVWVFWSADGFYYFGSFDGERFQTDCVRHLAYRSSLPYAAQTFAGTDRVLSVAWMRTKNGKKDHTGVYGVPRELTLKKAKDTLCLCLTPAKEIRASVHKKAIPQDTDIQSAKGLFLDTVCAAGADIEWQICGTGVHYNSVSGMLCCNGTEAYFAPNLSDFSFIVSSDLIEITAERDTLFAAFENNGELLTGKIKIIAKTKTESQLGMI